MGCLGCLQSVGGLWGSLPGGRGVNRRSAGQAIHIAQWVRLEPVCLQVRNGAHEQRDLGGAAQEVFGFAPGLVLRQPHHEDGLVASPRDDHLFGIVDDTATDRGEAVSGLGEIDGFMMPLGFRSMDVFCTEAGGVLAMGHTARGRELLPQLGRQGRVSVVMMAAPDCPTQAGASEQRRAFEAFYAESAPAILRQMLVVTGQTAEAQDCVQEAYARAWQRWASVGALDNPAGWVRQVAYRCAVSRWRKATNRLQAHFREAHRPPEPDLTAEVVSLMAALRLLPTQQREVIALFHLADLPLEEVARTLGVPVNTVKTRLLRGRATLRQALGDRGDDAEAGW